jgi:hypothetical protein
MRGLQERILRIKCDRTVLTYVKEASKCTWEENGMYGGGVEITAIIAIYKVSVSVYFPSEGQITPP